MRSEASLGKRQFLLHGGITVAGTGGEGWEERGETSSRWTRLSPVHHHHHRHHHHRHHHNRQKLLTARAMGATNFQLMDQILPGLLPSISSMSSKKRSVPGQQKTTRDVTNLSVSQSLSPSSPLFLQDYNHPSGCLPTGKASADARKSFPRPIYHCKRHVIVYVL